MPDPRTFTSPLAVHLPRKTRPARKVILNLNNYRNWAFHLSDDVKKRYCEDMREQLAGVRLKAPVRLKFTLYRGNARQGDRANVLSVHEKFLCDALTHFGCLPDDNDEFIESTHYYTGAIDRANPRVVVEIIENYAI